MKIGLHDAEKDYFRKHFPNLALMKLSAFHKAQGDTVEWWQPLGAFDKVYSSKIFNFTPENEYLPPDAVRGGTGYSDIPLVEKLPDNVENSFPDYSIYPECNYAIGYLTRGCVRHCPWCVVPEKEGLIRPYRRWQEVVRPDSDLLTLMDNNILACQYGISQLEELAETSYKVDLNQGMDARLVTSEIAEILAKIKWQRFLRFSCDCREQLEAVEKTIELLGENGIKPYRISLYLLVTSDVDDASYRVECLKKYKALSFYANGRAKRIQRHHPESPAK